MPARTRHAHARHLVTAVLVAHDGARWLPTVLPALAQQTRPPQHLVAVDTGSRDDTPALLEAALGAGAVLQLPRDTGFGAAVRAGLEACPGPAGADEPSPGGSAWVWLLHDDCAPDPGALEALLDLAADSPSVAVIGPKVLTWDGAHLAEVGLTTDVTGRRETGLERHEVDHGQHDGVGDVLAVGSAGVLVRRDLWDRLGGYDPALALLRDDLDFGWRANLTGARVVVAPRAVVRHASALAAGLRRPDATGRSFRRTDRQHAIRVLAADLPPLAAAFAMPRLLLGALLRGLGLFLFRRPGAAFDELAAFLAVLLRPHEIVRARAARRPLRTRPAGEVRHLLAGPGARMRHRGEWVAELLAGRRPDLQEGRFRRRRSVETGPVSEEAENLEVGGTGWVRRLVRKPWFLLLAGLTVTALVAERGVLSGALTGGRLLPVPGGASDLWATYLAGWHPVGLGSAVPAPPYLALVALLGTVLLGKAWLAVAVLLLGAVPLAGLAAFRATRLLTDRLALRLWAAVAYALLPAVTGAVAGGRLDVVGAAIVLPLAAAGLGRLLRDDPRVTGWHRPAGVGLLLAVATAFAPVVYVALAPVMLLAALVVLAGGRVAGGTSRRSALAVVGALVVPPIVLVPWTGHLLSHPALLVAGAGLPEPLRRALPTPAHDLLLLHPGGPAQPWLYAAVPLVLAALAGLARRDRVRAGAVAGLVAVAGLAAAVAASRTTVGAADQRAWAGAATLVTGVGFLGAALLFADGLQERLARRTFGWRQPMAGLLVALAAAVPVWTGVAWLVRGADRPLHAGGGQVAPAFVLAELASAARPRALVLRPDAQQVRFALIGATGAPVLGDADVGPAAGATSGLAEVVRQLAGGGGSDVPAALAAYGVRFVVVPGPGGALAGTLDRTRGITPGQSAGAAVWRVEQPAGRLAVLPPAAAAQATSGAAPTSAARTGVRLLPSGAAGARARVEPGPAGRLLVLDERASDAWRAAVDGRPLAARTAYGWAQAFELPAAGGALVLSHTSDRTAWLGGELAALVIAVLAALPSVRRRDDEEAEA